MNRSVFRLKYNDNDLFFLPFENMFIFIEIFCVLNKEITNSYLNR